MNQSIIQRNTLCVSKDSQPSIMTLHLSNTTFICSAARQDKGTKKASVVHFKLSQKSKKLHFLWKALLKDAAS